MRKTKSPNMGGETTITPLMQLQSDNNTLREKIHLLEIENDKLKTQFTKNECVNIDSLIIEKDNKIDELQKEKQQISHETLKLKTQIDSLKNAQKNINSTPITLPETTRSLTVNEISSRLDYCTSPTRRGIELVMTLAENSSEWIQVTNAQLCNVMESKYISSFRDEGCAMGLMEYKKDNIPQTKRTGFFYRLNA